MTGKKYFGAVLIAALIQSGGCQSEKSVIRLDYSDPDQSEKWTNNVPGGDFQTVVSKAGKRVFPAVVYIRVVRSDLADGKASNQVVSGSGVVITPQGEVLTNYHVIDKALEIRCLLNDGSARTATLIGSDKEIDLALLRLDSTPEEGELNVPAAELSHSKTLQEGSFVMAMGAPWGLNRSVSIGIISCGSRYLPDNSQYTLWYQTDAAILPGNSGGPLVDTEGNVVGINTLGASVVGSLGFTLPATTILDVLPRLREYGQVNWAWFGLQLQPLRDFDRNIYFNYPDGVIVSGTDPGSPARKAGFLPNDRIVAMDGQKVTVHTIEEMPDFRRKLGLLPFGVPVRFTIVRNGETQEITVAPTPKGEIEGDELACPRWGLTFKAINRFDTPEHYFYRENGVYIFGVAQPGNAWRASISANDILTAVDGEPVETLADLKKIYERAVENVDNSPRVTLTLLRNGQMIQKVLDFSIDFDKE